MIIRKGREEIERIARAGELAAATIRHTAQHLAPGITTAELDQVAGARARPTSATVTPSCPARSRSTWTSSVGVSSSSPNCTSRSESIERSLSTIDSA